jgi:hypothetical protein
MWSPVKFDFIEVEHSAMVTRVWRNDEEEGWLKNVSH